MLTTADSQGKMIKARLSTLTDITYLAGFSTLISEHSEMAQEADTAEVNVCRKDTGDRKRIRSWSQGYQFVISGGGHIEAFAPLFE